MQSQLDIDLKSHPRVNLQPLMEIHLVEREDVFYKAGRHLAKEVYREVWNTQNLVDGNDYAVIVACKGKIVGNINIQLKKPKSLLKSEIFFGEKHWEDYFQVEDSEIAEISALAIAKDAPTELRRPVMMMLITGVQNICRIRGIKFLATVQHSYLLRILNKSLKLPFYKNTTVTQPVGDIPNDDYWKREKYPAIYYLDILSFEMVNVCYSFLSYLNLSGLQTQFLPRINQSKDLSYASFVRQWHEDTPIKN